MRKNLILSATISLAIIVTLLFVFVPKAIQRKNTAMTEPSVLKTTETSVTSHDETTVSTTQATVQQTTQMTEAETTPMPEMPEPETSPSIPPVTEPSYVAPTFPGETEPEKITFPYAVPDTSLVIEKVNSYDGIYLEDGSDIEISGVAAIILKNTGKKCTEYARIEMVGQQTTFTFEVSGMVPGAIVVVMEAGKAPAVSQEYNQITAEVAQIDSFEISGETLLMEETENGQLKITNLTQEDIPCVRIFYKFYLDDVKVYVGGITYTAKIVDLKAGASAEIAPSHYAVGSSRVIMAKTYDTVEE